MSLESMTFRAGDPAIPSSFTKSETEIRDSPVRSLRL